MLGEKYTIRDIFMKTLKESILSRSSHGAKGFEVQRRIETIKEWLKEYDIENYIINRDFTIDINGDAELFVRDLKEFPEYIQFGVVRGNFNCSSNGLISLRGCPRKVEGKFDCRWNKLTSLEGAPKEVGGYFDCSNNYITTLKGAPEKVGNSFYCRSNKLITLEGSPKEIKGHFNCENNQLTSLKGAPERVKKFFICSYNKLTSLEGAPKKVEGSFYCSQNPTKFTEEDVRRVCDVKEGIHTN